MDSHRYFLVVADESLIFGLLLGTIRENFIFIHEVAEHHAMYVQILLKCKSSLDIDFNIASFLENFIY